MTQKDVFKSSAYHKWGLTSHHAVMFIISYCHNSNKSPRHVEFVNYSWRASENCILLAPLGKYAVFISGLLLRIYASFVVAFKLVLENMLSHASTMFHSVLKETLKNIQFFKGRWKLEWGKWKLNLTCPTGQVAAKVNVVPWTIS